MHSTSSCFPLELRPHHGGTFPACSGGLWAIPSPFQLGLQQSCVLAETAEQQIPSCGSSLQPQDVWGAANPGDLGECRDATLHQSRAAQRCMGLYIPGAHLPAAQG